MSIFQQALAIVPTLHKQHNVIINNSYHRQLTMDVAAYAIEKNKLEEAVEILEQGQGLVWLQLHSFRTPLDQLAETNKELVDKFRSVNQLLENLIMSCDASMSDSTVDGAETLDLHVRKLQENRESYDRLFRLKQQLSDQLEVIINEIRQVPGFESFPEATPFSILRQVALEGPVIMVNRCEYRSDALIILPCDDSSVVCVPLDAEFNKDSVNLCNEYLETRFLHKANSPEYDIVLRKAMKMLWDRVVFKVVGKLKELGIAEGSHIWWCPTGNLSALPFHAAGPFEDSDGIPKYLLDDYISSYTPTLRGLINARSEGAEEEPTVLVIGDTSLRSAKQEIKNIRNCGMRTKLLLNKKACRDTVVEHLPETTWVHFACHGLIDPNPFDSSFKLSGNGLTLLDIVQANLPNAEFAFLSACHTAELSHTCLQDEALHLAAAIQFCGFRSVIGTMWELLDSDGPHFAKTVYEYINECKEGEAKYKRAAAGLRRAALELKAREGIATERWVNLVHIGA